jgi:phosphoglycolate phosphatase
MIKHVLFDVDGTLTEPSRGVINAILYAMPAMGLPVPENTDSFKIMLGPPLLDSFQNILGLSEADARRMLRIYREYYAETGLFEAYVYDGILPLLTSLQKDGYLLHTVTSKPIEYVERLFDRFDLRRYFTFLAADDLVGSRRTKTMVLDYLLGNVADATPENAIMIGDRKFDVHAAHERGLRVIGCAWGHAVPGELEEAGADFIANTPEDARRIILSL